MDFWTRLDHLVTTCEMVIDRPKGSRHPRYPECVYPLDYGYLKGTSGGDGDNVDVWRGSERPAQPGAVICTIDTLKGDVEVKLLVRCTDEETEMARRFYSESEYMSGLVVNRCAESI